MWMICTYMLLKKAWQQIPLFISGSLKLDGVGQVDNRPSTDKLQHFVKTTTTTKITCDT